MSGMKSSLGLGNKANRHRRHKTLTEALIKMRCGACGQMGHMRTNKECPMYGRGGGNPSASLQNDAGVRRTTATPTTTERGHLRSQTSLRNLSRSFDDLGNSKLDDRGELSFLEANCYTGRKLEPETIAAAQALASRPVCELLAEQEEEEEQEAKGHHGHGTDSLDDRHHSKDSDDFDESSMHSALGENDMTGLTQIPGYKIFMHPVKEKDFPNYYSQIDTPMDLSQIRMKINENSYATREEFLSDIRLIYNNSSKFNESLVNPLLDEDDLVGLSYLLQQAIEAMRSVEHSRPFHIPVDKRRYPVSGGGSLLTLLLQTSLFLLLLLLIKR
ncbi:unnamed protein product [Trichobilharzia regenti]|nr:unnamed protein product [Trichobilharzia regenti]